MNKRWDKNTLAEITGFAQSAAQKRWFKKSLGTDVPCDAKGVVMNDSTYDALLKQRCGLIQQIQSTQKNKPKLR